MKLFYIILGCTPEGRNIEQHDVFFGIAEELRDLVPQLQMFWPEAQGKIHIDAYQEVRFVDGFEVKIMEKPHAVSQENLYFINLGGYKRGCFDELHEKFLMADTSMANVVKRAKQTDFYKNMNAGASAVSHIDEKFGVDIDDIFSVNDILPPNMKEKYLIFLEKSNAEIQENPIKMGYFKIDKL